MNFQKVLIIAGILLGLFAHSSAQPIESELPQYTVEQRWERSGRLSTVNFAVMIAYA